MVGESGFLHTVRFHALGGPSEIQFVVDKDDVDPQSIAEKARSEVSRIEAKFSRYRTTSIISQINDQAGKEPFQVDSETAALLNIASICFGQSDGLFDITSGVLRKVWNFKKREVPTKEAMKDVLPLIGWEKVEWGDSFIRLPQCGMEIDLGGIGKEYCVDRVVSVLQESGVKKALVNLSGDIRVYGGHPSGGPWRVGIVNPDGTKKPLKILPIHDGGVATSGDYERCITIDGKRYSHLLNPKTGWPIESFQSVTVVGETSLLAGCVATTTMLLGEKQGIEYLHSTGLSGVIVSGSGKVVACPEGEAEEILFGRL